MNTKCEMIKDILPLYADHTCSEESRKIVEEHLSSCPDCRNTVEQMQQELFPSVDDAEILQDDMKVIKLLKKVRRRWIQSLVVILILILAVFPLARLCINEIKKEGRTFSNRDDIKVVEKMFSYIEKGEYDKAFDYFYMEDIYLSIIGSCETGIEYFEGLPGKNKDYKLTTIGTQKYYLNLKAMNADENTPNMHTLNEKKGDYELEFWFSAYKSQNYIIPQKFYNRIINEYKVNDNAFKLSTPYGVFCMYSYRLDGTLKATNLFDYIESDTINDGSTGFLDSKWYTLDKMYWISHRDLIWIMNNMGIIPQTILSEYNERFEKYNKKCRETALYYEQLGLEKFTELAKKHFVSKMTNFNAYIPNIKFKDAKYIPGFKIVDSEFIPGGHDWYLSFSLPASSSDLRDSTITFQVVNKKLIPNSSFTNETVNDETSEFLDVFASIGAFVPQK